MTMMTPKEELQLSLVFAGVLCTLVGMLYLVGWLLGIEPKQTTDGINAFLDGFMHSPVGPYKGVL